MTNTETATPRRRSYKIWHLTRKDDYGYGTNIEFVIVAETEQAARFTASDAAGKSDRHVWLDPRISHVDMLGKTELGAYDKPTVIVAVYHGE
jgi:phage anti-repressor protein